MNLIITNDHNGRRITIITSDGGPPIAVPGSHPNFDKIRDMATSPDADLDRLRELADLGVETVRQVERLSDRVTLVDGHLYFDGSLVDKTITRHIVRMHADDNPQWKSLVAFLENIATNPSAESRRHLYRFLTDLDFQLTSNGHFVAYKAVREDGTSVSSGPGIVDGVPVYGHLPNQVGSIIEFPRHQVDPDRGHACSVGLHVGTFDYASTFYPEGRLLTVEVNPRDVVAVPLDCESQKVRVCRYRVTGLADEPIDGTYYDPDDLDPDTPW